MMDNVVTIRCCNCGRKLGYVHAIHGTLPKHTYVDRIVQSQVTHLSDTPLDAEFLCTRCIDSKDIEEDPTYVEV